MDILLNLLIGIIVGLYILMIIYYLTHKNTLTNDSNFFHRYNTVTLYLPRLIYSYYVINKPYENSSFDTATHLGIKISNGHEYKSCPTVIYCHAFEYPFYLIWFWFHIFRKWRKNRNSDKMRSMDEFNKLYKVAKDKADTHDSSFDKKYPI